MALHVHEIHAAVIHGPLVLLPTAAAVDLVAAVQGDRRKAGVGRTLWWAAVGSGVFAGLAGLAASQEVKADVKEADDMMWLHGTINATLLVGTIGMAVYRSTRRPTVTSALLGLATSAASFYTAYLGGEMVYTHGLGVKAMPESQPNGVSHSPPVLSREALPAFVKDAGRGLAWLLSRAAQALRGRDPVAKGAFGHVERTPAPGSALPGGI